jgi:hypothetical protein
MFPTVPAAVFRDRSRRSTYGFAHLAHVDARHINTSSSSGCSAFGAIAEPGGTWCDLRGHNQTSLLICGPW